MIEEIEQWIGIVTVAVLALRPVVVALRDLADRAVVWALETDTKRDDLWAGRAATTIVRARLLHRWSLGHRHAGQLFGER